MKRRLQTNKSGILVLSDLLWFLIFVLCAALIFFFLYHPLNLNAQGKAGTTFEQTRLIGDAQFTAISLVQTPADIPHTDSQGVRSVTRGTFGELAAAVADEPNNPELQLAFKDAVEQVFVNRQYWQVSQTVNAQTARSSEKKYMQELIPTSIAVTVVSGGILRAVTCTHSTSVTAKQAIAPPPSGDAVDRRSTPTAYVFSCAQKLVVGNAAKSADEIVANYPQTPDKDSALDGGQAYVPADSGPVTVQVFINLYNRNQLLEVQQ